MQLKFHPEKKPTPLQHQNWPVSLQSATKTKKKVLMNFKITEQK